MSPDAATLDTLEARPQALKGQPAPAALRVAIIGAGPAGLSLALQLAQAIPELQITLFDARAPLAPAGASQAGDARTLALSLGTVQSFERMGLWERMRHHGPAQAITQVRVSQQQPSWSPGLGTRLAQWFGHPSQAPSPPRVCLSAEELGLPMLGAVLPYSPLLHVLEQVWLAQAASRPQRLISRFDCRVRALKPLSDSRVEVDADIAETHDLAVIAEGGVFADQAALSWPQGVSRDYQQVAWVGEAHLPLGRLDAVAIEHFTPQGPLALLPLAPAATHARFALVWCVSQADNPLAQWSDAQRLAVLNASLPAEAACVQALSPLKPFALGLHARLSQLESPSMVRIGNAAQTMHPVAGQGLNLAMRDVHELSSALKGVAWHVLDESERAAQLARVLAQWSRRRQADRWSLLATTDTLARLFVGHSPLLSSLRGWGLAGVDALPALRRQLARQMMFGLR